MILKQLSEHKNIINIDETWINETSHTRKTWAPRDGSGNVKLNTVSPRLSMITALDTEGRIWFSLSHANTDSNTMMVFLHYLMKALDNETPDWRDNTLLLWDNASYHRSHETKTIVQKMGLKIIYSGPYGYSASPIELLFGSLKVGEINLEDVPTGKR